MRGWKNSLVLGRGAWCAALLTSLIVGWAATPERSTAQDAAARDAAAREAAAPAKESPTAKKRTEPRGRLPAYFGEVIDSQQRDKVYELQAKYTAEIKQLQDQIAKLEQQRDEAVQGILTPEQAEKVRKLVEDGKAKRGATGTRKKGGSAPGAADSASN